MALKRILVATDFSPAARCALWRAGDLASRNEANLHVVHARPDWNLFVPAPGAQADQYRAVAERTEDALREDLAFLETTFGVHARAETRMGRASQVLLAVIAETQPQLVIVGARGEHAEGPVPLLGGTALKLLAFSSRPVLVVRTDGSGPYRTAVAAVECASEAAEGLVSWARTLLGEGNGEGNCECHIVHVFDAPYAQRMRRHGVAEDSIQTCSDVARADAKAFMELLLEESDPMSPRMHLHLLRGEPVATVLEHVERCDPDLVIVGKHGHPPREQHLSALGSIALRIAYHVPGDVLVVP